MTLSARDEAGNEAKSEPHDMRLPERLFTKPLARALIEQRRILALDANQVQARHHGDLILAKRLEPCGAVVLSGNVLD